jgi:hypothetical protein
MLLRNIELREMYNKACGCHTCFVKLPVVTVVLVTIIVLSS